MRWYRWLLLNVGIFVATATLFSYASTSLDVMLGARFDPVTFALAPVTFFVFLGPLYVPGFLVHLVALRVIPRSWDHTSRRLAAIATSPAVGGLVWMIGMFGGALIAVAAYALLLPLCYGCVARLVDPGPAEHAAGAPASNA